MGRGINEARLEAPHTRRRARERLLRSNGGPYVDEDVDMLDPDETRPLTFIVAVDYGTTYTSVSYVKFDPDERPKVIGLHDIKPINHWPDVHGWLVPAWFPQVPSESWYADGKHFWGFGAFKIRRNARSQSAVMRGSSIVGAGFCPKILLSESQDTDDRRQDLRNALKSIGKDTTDIVTDYLVEILSHTKEQLKQFEKYNEACDIELVLCVPAAWNATDRRGWQEIMGAAATRADFGSIDNFWMLHEPEAATAFVLEDQSRLSPRVAKFNWKKNDTFIVCDAGGGTVDTITYRIESLEPLRVAEVTSPLGEHCGSQYINETLYLMVYDLLKTETYLTADGESLEDIINSSVIYRFETEIKPTFKSEDDDPWVSFDINGLEANPEKNFLRSTLRIRRSDIASCFQKSIDGVIELVRRQFEAASETVRKVLKEDRRYPTKILLVGGFGNCPMLKSALEKAFAPRGMTVVCDLNNDLSMMVSQGALIRAVNKSSAPRRLIYLNYGILRHEECTERSLSHCPSENVGNNYANRKHYVWNSIDWMIKKNQKIAFKHKKTCQSYQIFEEHKSWKLWETVYVSEEKVKDGIPYDQGCNINAVVAGEIEVDLSDLKEQGLVAAQRHDERSPWYWEVKYDLVMEVEGLNLTFYVRWPREGDVYGQPGRISLAAAFRPGTA